ncbi:hypothetical protein ECPA39_3826, partial [Escherichia coli PA39]
MVKTYSNIH